MKYLVALAIPFLLNTQTANAQAWSKDTKVISVGVAAANYYHVGSTTATIVGPTSSFYAPVTGQITVEGEFGIHDYIGVGFNSGFGGGAAAHSPPHWLVSSCVFYLSPCLI